MVQRMVVAVRSWRLEHFEETLHHAYVDPSPPSKRNPAHSNEYEYHA
jgi:hypothetical protein